MRVRDAEGESLPPPTAEEQRRALALLEQLRAWRAQVLAARGGRYFSSAAELVRELRAEQGSAD